MSARLSPTQTNQFPSPAYAAPDPSERWHAAPPIEADADGIPWSRYLDVLRRHLLLIVGLAAIGSAVGIYAARGVKPIYDAQTTIWINSSSNPESGPIRARELLSQTAWEELLRSFAIVDPVVQSLKLNVSTKFPLDSVLFRSFNSGNDIRAGTYSLGISRDRANYVLSAVGGKPVERGSVGNPIGHAVGFTWNPPPELLKPGRLVIFSVRSPRSVSLALLAAMRTSLPERGQFMRVMLSGSDPHRTAATVNGIAEQFVRSAGDLKKRNLLEFKKLLGDQLAVAERELRNSEIQLEQFRVNTITLPSEDSPLTGGVQATRDPVISGYFQQKSTLDDVRNDRLALERMIGEAKGGPINTQAFLLLPSILANTPQLRSAIEELSTRQTALRTEQQFLTDENPRIKQLAEAVRVLENQTIPQITLSALETLRAREGELNKRIDTQSRELRAIPSRTIEEMRLVRQVSATENLYNTLKVRYEEVSLAEAQTTPDVSVLDFAVAPVHPSSDGAPRLVMLAILGSIALAGLLAILHDRLDRRFRYPDEATRELGLAITGTVPRLKANRHGTFNFEMMAQAVESFRTLRLAVQYEFPGDAPIVVSVASPGAGDGKSLVSSNLALAFASTGHRTLLIDGDVRCGTQHSTFDVPVSPGLVDFLSGSVGMEAVMKRTSTANLYLLPRGARRTDGPELLVSERMASLLNSARQQFEVVIIDSAPFVAGVDAYALAAAAGSMLVVLRPAVSDRKLAAAKLTIFDRLPIRVLGTVLNGVPAGGMYRYYSHDYYYRDTQVTAPIGSLATPGGLVRA